MTHDDLDDHRPRFGFSRFDGRPLNTEHEQRADNIRPTLYAAGLRDFHVTTDSSKRRRKEIAKTLEPGENLIERYDLDGRETVAVATKGRPFLYRQEPDDADDHCSAYDGEVEFLRARSLSQKARQVQPHRLDLSLHLGNRAREVPVPRKLRNLDRERRAQFQACSIHLHIEQNSPNWLTTKGTSHGHCSVRRAYGVPRSDVRDWSSRQVTY